MNKKFQPKQYNRFWIITVSTFFMKPGTIEFLCSSLPNYNKGPKLYVKLVPEMITTSHALVHTSTKETNGFIQTINASRYDCLYTWLSLCIVFIIFRGILIDLMGWWYCLLSWKDSHAKKIKQNLPTVLNVAKSQYVGSHWTLNFEQWRWVRIIITSPKMVTT